jgi:hypothetical protein
MEEKSMRKLGFLIAAALAVAVPAQAVPIGYSTSLRGTNEVPPNASPAIGSAQAIIDTTAHTLTIHAFFEGLLAGNTAAHIHCCAPAGVNAMVATSTPTFTGFPTGLTSGAYSRVFDLTLASSWNAAFITAHGGTIAQAEADFAAALAAGTTYFNIHSSLFPGGEIRGQMALMPEPATLTLLGLGLGAAALRRRRRS